MWASTGIFYHIYPLGLLGVASKNKAVVTTPSKIKELHSWLIYIKDLGYTALLIGPVWESMSHGYDTIDYFKLDKRLGTNDDFKLFCEEAKRLGIRLVLDAVFNHVGRAFWAFKDVQQKKNKSDYITWFSGVDFTQNTPFNDGFKYNSWDENYHLVTLDLNNVEVQQHIFKAVSFWITEFHIDGLRLDAADVMDKTFFSKLRFYCDSISQDFWLMGEVVHGEYKDWVSNGRLHSVTNYSLHTPLFESLEQGNYQIVSNLIEKQYAAPGYFKTFPLYTFTDNHDVDRAASRLAKAVHLYPLYGLLFMLPGVPAIYYGSELGITGKRYGLNDSALRPTLRMPEMFENAPHPDLRKAIQRFIRIRNSHTVLQSGYYKTLYVVGRQYVFKRFNENGEFIIAVNSSPKPIEMEIKIGEEATYEDQLEDHKYMATIGGRLTILIYPNWLCILKRK